MGGYLCTVGVIPSLFNAFTLNEFLNFRRKTSWSASHIEIWRARNEVFSAKIREFVWNG